MSLADFYTTAKEIYENHEGFHCGDKKNKDGRVNISTI